MGGGQDLKHGVEPETSKNKATLSSITTHTLFLKSQISSVNNVAVTNLQNIHM